MKLPAFHKHGT